jgi:hypothetical protein
MYVNIPELIRVSSLYFGKPIYSTGSTLASTLRIWNEPIHDNVAILLCRTQWRWELFRAEGGGKVKWAELEETIDLI